MSFAPGAGEFARDGCVQDSRTITLYPFSCPSCRNFRPLQFGHSSVQLRDNSFLFVSGGERKLVCEKVACWDTLLAAGASHLTFGLFAQRSLEEEMKNKLRQQAPVWSENEKLC